MTDGNRPRPRNGLTSGIEDEDDDEDDGSPAGGKRIMSLPNMASLGTARKLAARERRGSLRQGFRPEP